MRVGWIEALEMRVEAVHFVKVEDLLDHPSFLEKPLKL